MTRTWVPAGIRVVLAALLVTACAGIATRESWPVSLDGTAWRAVEVSGQLTVPGSEPTVTFADGEVTGTGGCNSFGGAYGYSEGRIDITEAAWTLALCEGRVGDTEGLFAKALDGATSVSMDQEGNLILDGPDGSIRFVVEPQGG